MSQALGYVFGTKSDAAALGECMSSEKVVWILGAGFSKSLGGPLLNDLFPAQRILDLYLRPGAKDELSELVKDLFHALFDLPPPFTDPSSGPTFRTSEMWRDAETFLSGLDSLASKNSYSPHERLLIKKLVRGGATEDSELQQSLNHLSRQCRIWVAIQCSEFVDRTIVKSDDRWTGYRDWFQNLNAEDTLITFNYDLVVESCAVALDEKIEAKLNRPSIGGIGLRHQGVPTLLKLHGSVDWSWDVENPTSQTLLSNFDWRSFIKGVNDTKTIAIGMPGPSKLKYAREKFLPLWDLATEAIRNADRVIIIGFRFPATDAWALQQLFGALIDYVPVKPLPVHLVHGPTKMLEQERLEALLEWVNKRRTQNSPSATHCTVTTEPMYAEDFLSLARF